MNAIVEAPIRALALSDGELIDTLRNSLFPGATDNSIKMVIAWCRATGKDPMKKPVHIVPMSVKKAGTRDQYEWRDVLMPGIVDYRTDAARTGAHAGNDEAVFGPTKSMLVGANAEFEYPEWCEFKVYRLVGGERCAFSSGRVRWLECYATAGRDSTAPNAMWRKRPFGQLEKCAEAMALRRAFPEVGAQPTADEMAGRVIEGGDTEVVVEGVVTAAAVAPGQARPETWPDDAFQARMQKWKAAIDSGQTVDAVLAFARGKGALTADQEAAIRALKPSAPPGGEHSDFVDAMDAAEANRAGDQS